MNYKFIVTAVLVLNLFTQIHAIARADIVPVAAHQNPAYAELSAFLQRK